MKIKTGKLLIRKRLNIVIILTVLLLFVTIAIPSFCMLLIKDNSHLIDYWDGTVATSYNSGSGTEEDPYIISNGEELAYLSQEINNGKTYDNIYFKLSENIHLNNGVIEHKNNLIIYTKDSKKYYIKPFTNEYYQEPEYITKVGNVNTFIEMKSFRGIINGNDKFIYGLYMTEEEDTSLSLFDNFKGNINNLYFSNSLIYGNYSVGLINNTENATYNNLIFNGYIYSKGLDSVKSYNLNNVELNENSQTINLTTESLPETSQITKISLKGNFIGESIYINDTLINNQEFELEFNEIPETIVFNSNNATATISDLVFEIKYNNNISSLINNANNIRISNSFIRGEIVGSGITSSLVGKATNNLEINNTFNDANIKGKYINSGLIGVMENASINMGSIYNSGNVTGEMYSGGIFGIISSSYNINIHDSFNSGNIHATNKGAIAASSVVDIINHNNYHTNENIQSIGNNSNVASTYKEKSELLTLDFLTTQLKFTNTSWNVSNNELPKLVSFDNQEPIVTLKMLDYTWTNINNQEIKITEPSWIDIEYQDEHSDILKIEYHIGNKLYSIEQLSTLEYELYENNISLEENGDYYIIFKTTDVIGNVNITTTDLITLDGYSLQISDIYDKSLKNYDNQISYDSSIKYNFKRNYLMENFKYPETISYMLKSNVLLPDNTTIKLVDNINHSIYSYIVNEEDISYINNTYLYDLSLFKELGTTTDNYFDNKLINYYKQNKLEENIDFIFNFKNTDIKENTKISLDLLAIDNNTIYSTTYTNQDTTHTLVKYDEEKQKVSYSFNISTDYKEYIDMSQINSYDINLVNQIKRSKLNNKEIYSESINTDKLHLLIKIHDSNEKLITGNLINSIGIEYGDKTYYSNNYGYIQIPFINNDINLKLNVNYIINDVVNGLYYLKINTCNSVGICGEETTIPIKISNTVSNIDCNFNVNIDDKDRLISRNQGQNFNNRNNMNVNIEYDGILTNPNIRIKLYKKMNFDSTNQVYELIDLSQYISNKLELIKDYQYYLTKEVDKNMNKTINLLINNFEYGAYKLVFELYDGESFVKEDNKTFIVK